MKYNTKKCTIDAVQWTGLNIEEINDFITDNGYFFLEDENDPNGSMTLNIKTLEGTMTANWGDYIIKGIENEFYPCKESVFNMKYELAEPNIGEGAI